MLIAHGLRAGEVAGLRRPPSRAIVRSTCSSWSAAGLNPGNSLGLMWSFAPNPCLRRSATLSRTRSFSPTHALGTDACGGAHATSLPDPASGPSPPPPHGMSDGNRGGTAALRERGITSPVGKLWPEAMRWQSGAVWQRSVITTRRCRHSPQDRRARNPRASAESLGGQRGKAPRQPPQGTLRVSGSRSACRHAKRGEGKPSKRCGRWWEDGCGLGWLRRLYRLHLFPR